MTPLSAGELIRRVTFDQPVATPNGMGGTRNDWTKGVYTCRAKIMWLRGTEAVMEARLVGRQPVVVTIRNCAAARAIGTDWVMRDLDTGTVYVIHSSPNPSDDRQWLDITAESGVPVG